MNSFYSRNLLTYLLAVSCLFISPLAFAATSGLSFEQLE